MSTPQSPNTNPGYIMRTDGRDSELRVGVGMKANGSVVVNGVDLGPVAGLADLVELAAIGRLAVEKKERGHVEPLAIWAEREIALNKAMKAYLAKRKAQR